MSYEKFTWKPDLGSECSEDPNVTTSKFGDGYEYRLQNGINANPQKWSLTFTTELESHNQIVSFLKKMGALKAFEWMSPDQNSGVYVCRGWKRKQSDFGVFVVTATFEQVFETSR